MSAARSAALVTGASRGIGRIIARDFASRGYDLTISARARENVEPLAAELAADHGVRVVAVGADMGNDDDVRVLAAAHSDTYGRADVVVLNAGMGDIGSFESYPLSRVDKLYAINFRSAYCLVQLLLPLLRAAGSSEPRGGKVIAVASSTGLVGEPLNSAYGASKAALISWCETLNAEESVAGVTATAVCPGYVATDMTKGLDGETPWQEMPPAEDVSRVVVSLAELSKRTVVPRVAMVRPGAQLWRA